MTISLDIFPLLLYNIVKVFPNSTKNRIQEAIMEHHNPLLRGSENGKKFITIGEIMLRLTPPNYEKRYIFIEFR